MAQVIALLLAFFKAVPAAKELWDRLVVAYTAAALATMKQENKDAIRKVIEEHDQRDAEKAIGHPFPGMPSGDPGAVIVDKPKWLP